MKVVYSLEEYLVMVRTVDTATARAQLEHLVDQARDHGDSIIIERDGRPAAALVPVAVLDRQRRDRQSFVEALKEFQAGVQTDLSEAEVGELIDREVAAVRQERFERDQAEGRPQKP
jgi:prevent-host-death family protein